MKLIFDETIILNKQNCRTDNKDLKIETDANLFHALTEHFEFK